MFCNNCGDCLADEDQSLNQTLGAENLSVKGCYSSTHLTDCTKYTFSLCEKCLRSMFESFKIPPKVNDTRTDFSFSYKKEREDFYYYLWVNKGLALEAYKNNRCNQVENCNKKALYTFFEGIDTQESSCEDHKSKRFISEWQNFIPYKMLILI
jgi:hypothetical protein